VPDNTIDIRAESSRPQTKATLTNGRAFCQLQHTQINKKCIMVSFGWLSIMANLSQQVLFASINVQRFIPIHACHDLPSFSSAPMFDSCA
jgi:hypothetical protein